MQETRTVFAAPGVFYPSNGHIITSYLVRVAERINFTVLVNPTSARQSSPTHTCVETGRLFTCTCRITGVLYVELSSGRIITRYLVRAAERINFTVLVTLTAKLAVAYLRRDRKTVHLYLPHYVAFICTCLHQGSLAGMQMCGVTRRCFYFHSPLILLSFIPPHAFRGQYAQSEP